MKKIITSLVIFITTLVLVGCGGPKTYDEISFSELNTMLEQKEDFILFIGAESCSACKSYKVTVDKIVENNKLDIKYIDNDKLSEEEYAKLMSHFYFTATPTTVLVKNGKEKERITGNKKYSQLEQILKDNKYIKE